MSLPARSMSSHMRGPSGSVSQSAALSARIEEKRAELRHLKELRDLSGAVAAQMEALETKLSTLSDGTEAIATVMGNWHSVLRAINMSSSKLTSMPADDDKDPSEKTEPLPQTLVRIPTEVAPAVQAQTEAAEAAAAEESSLLSKT